MYGCFGCMYVYVLCAYSVFKEAKGRHQIPGIIIMDSCDWLCGCWEWDLGPLEEHPILLTSEPPLLPTQ